MILLIFIWNGHCINPTRIPHWGVVFYDQPQQGEIGCCICLCKADDYKCIIAFWATTSIPFHASVCFSKKRTLTSLGLC